MIMPDQRYYHWTKIEKKIQKPHYWYDLESSRNEISFLNFYSGIPDSNRQAESWSVRRRNNTLEVTVVTNALNC